MLKLRDVCAPGVREAPVEFEACIARLRGRLVPWRE